MSDDENWNDKGYNDDFVTNNSEIPNEQNTSDNEQTNPSVAHNINNPVNEDNNQNPIINNPIEQGKLSQNVNYQDNKQSIPIINSN